MTAPSNNGLHQTGTRGVAPFHSSEGQSLRGAPAGEAECWAGVRWATVVGGTMLVLSGTPACAQELSAMPTPADSSWEGSLARGARAPDMAGLQGTVIRYAVESWPRRDQGARRVSTLCLTVLPPPHS